MKGLLKTIGKSPIFVVFFMTSDAQATWQSYEYRDSNGEYKYGMKDGSNKVKLDLKIINKADKVANRINKNDKSVMQSLMYKTIIGLEETSLSNLQDYKTNIIFIQRQPFKNHK